MLSSLSICVFSGFNYNIYNFVIAPIEAFCLFKISLKHLFFNL